MAGRSCEGFADGLGRVDRCGSGDHGPGLAGAGAVEPKGLAAGRGNLASQVDPFAVRADVQVVGRGEEDHGLRVVNGACGHLRVRCGPRKGRERRCARFVRQPLSTNRRAGSARPSARGGVGPWRRSSRPPRSCGCRPSRRSCRSRQRAAPPRKLSGAMNSGIPSTVTTSTSGRAQTARTRLSVTSGRVAINRART